jgi:anti-sigma B factor antagonist
VSYTIRAQSDPGETVIEVIGDIDAAAADTLGSAFESATSPDERTLFVIVDLAGANFLDSRSIGTLATWQALIRATGGRVAITGTRPEVVRLFTLIGLEQTFEFFPSREAARAEHAKRSD